MRVARASARRPICICSTREGRAAPPHVRQRRTSLGARATERVRAVQLHGLERRDRVRLRDEAASASRRTAKYPIAFIVHGGPQVSFAEPLELSLERAGVRRPRLRAWCSSTSTAHPATARRSPIRSASTGAASRSRTCRRASPRRSQKYPWLDGKRACALGASYGGFMMNWIAGNWPDGFRCIVNHDGIFDTRSMYYSTEELWFTEWENGGPVLRGAGDPRAVQSRATT